MDDDICKNIEYCDDSKLNAVFLVKNAFKKEILGEWIKYLKKEIHCRNHDFDRDVAYFSQCTCDTMYGPTHHKSTDYPLQLYEIEGLLLTTIRKAFPKIFDWTMFSPSNSCHLNFYNHGKCGIAPHQDKQPMLDSIRKESAIFSFGLDEMTKFTIHSQPDIIEKKICLENGDMAIMIGMFQTFKFHSVKSIGKARSNVTFRNHRLNLS